MNYLRKTGVLLVSILMLNQAASAEAEIEKLLNRADLLEQSVKKSSQITRAEFEELINMTIKLGKPSMLDACIGKLDKVDGAGSILQKLYLHRGDAMWRQDSVVPLMGSYIKLARYLDDDQILAELEKDVIKFVPWKINDPKSPWELNQKHPKNSAVSYLVSWLAEKRGVDSLKNLYITAISKNRLDIISIIIGGYVPQDEDKIEVAKLFIYINKDLTSRENGEWIKNEIKTNALWLENDIYKPLLELKNIYEP